MDNVPEATLVEATGVTLLVKCAVVGAELFVTLRLPVTLATLVVGCVLLLKVRLTVGVRLWVPVAIIVVGRVVDDNVFVRVMEGVRVAPKEIDRVKLKDRVVDGVLLRKAVGRVLVRVTLTEVETHRVTLTLTVYDPELVT